MFKTLFKRIFILCALAFTFTAWGSLPEKIEIIEEKTKDLAKESVPTLNHWLKILDALAKRPQNKIEQSEQNVKEPKATLQNLVALRTNDSGTGN